MAPAAAVVRQPLICCNLFIRRIHDSHRLRRGRCIGEKTGLETRIGSRLSLGIGFNKNRLRRKNYEAAICFNWIYVSNCAFGRHFCRCECQRGTGDFVPAAFSPAVLQKKHTEKAFGACINGGNRVFRLFWGVSDKCLSGFRPGRF